LPVATPVRGMYSSTLYVLGNSNFQVMVMLMMVMMIVIIVMMMIL